MCVGLLPVDRLLRAKATAAGHAVVLYGATTGRDGIGGASVLASQELGDESAEKRPSVQIGDPFTGKKLIEASIALVGAGLVESLQDCGAAGIASALSEMAADYGIDVHLDRVPLREEGMEPWEIMISESQERMIAIVREPMLEAVEAVLDRWELHHAVIGEVTDTGELRAFWDDEPVGEIPARFLTEECPRYDLLLEPRPASPPSEIADAARRRGRALRAARLPEHPEPRVRLSPLRPARRLADRSPPRTGRGCPSAPAVHARARGQPRRPGPDCPPRPEAGRRARRPRGRAQRRVRGRRADRPHELPQLRQSGEARDRLGALGGDRGHVRRVPRARRADRLRQRVALQRDEWARDPPDARRRRGGPRAGRAPRPEGVARGRRAVRRGCVSALARRLRAAGALRPGGRLARLSSTSRPRRGSSRSSGGRRPTAR